MLDEPEPPVTTETEVADIADPMRPEPLLDEPLETPPFHDDAPVIEPPSAFAWAAPAPKGDAPVADDVPEEDPRPDSPPLPPVGPADVARAAPTTRMAAPAPPALPAAATSPPPEASATAAPSAPHPRSPSLESPDALARPLVAPRPEFPRAAQLRGIEGDVLVAVDIDAAGGVLAIRLARSSGSRLLDDAALKSVARWRFEPARRAGTAVPSVFEALVRFRLDDVAR